jgi:hypothetical protein
MNYSVEEKKMIVEAFIKCKKHLCDGGATIAPKTPWICNALYKASLCEQCPGSDMAEQIVLNRLDGAGTVSDYLMSLPSIKKEDLTPLNVQMFRHRWVDELIREFSE